MPGLPGAPRGAARSAGFLPSAYAGKYTEETLGTITLLEDDEGLSVCWSDLDSPVLPAGGHRFLVPRIPGNQPATFEFQVRAGPVLAFLWGPREFVREQVHPVLEAVLQITDGRSP